MALPKLYRHQITRCSITEEMLETRLGHHFNHLKWGIRKENVRQQQKALTAIEEELQDLELLEWRGGYLHVYFGHKWSPIVSYQELFWFVWDKLLTYDCDLRITRQLARMKKKAVRA